MSFVEGPTLRQHLDRVRRVSLSDTLRIACDLLSALEYAHEREIVHRDVKPENVVLSCDGPILVDFGIARAIASSGLGDARGGPAELARTLVLRLRREYGSFLWNG